MAERPKLREQPGWMFLACCYQADHAHADDYEVVGLGDSIEVAKRLCEGRWNYGQQTNGLRWEHEDASNYAFPIATAKAPPEGEHALVYAVRPIHTWTAAPVPHPAATDPSDGGGGRG